MEIQTKKGTIVLYSSIDELPFDRFNSFNKFVMLDSELGSTVQDFDKNWVRVMEYINKQMYDEAKKNMVNVRMTYNNIMELNSPKGLAFASLVKSINGKEVTEFSTSKLKEVLKIVESHGIQVKQIYSGVDDVKKKLNLN